MNHRLLPPTDVRGVLVLHADRLAIERRFPRWCEVEDELVTVVDEPLTVDRLVMTHREVFLVDRNRFDPVDGVLQLEVRTNGLGHVECRPWIRGLCADVQEQRPARVERTRGAVDPPAGPREVVITRNRIVVTAVANAEVIRRGSDDDVERGGWELAENVEAIAQIKTERGATDRELRMGLREAGHRTRFYRASVSETGLRSFRRDVRRGNSLGVNRVIAAMAVHLATHALLFDVGQLAARRQLAILPNHAPTR
jgi:hypothetical protein